MLCPADWGDAVQDLKPAGLNGGPEAEQVAGTGGAPLQVILTLLCLLLTHGWDSSISQYTLWDLKPLKTLAYLYSYTCSDTTHLLKPLGSIFTYFNPTHSSL